MSQYSNIETIITVIPDTIEQWIQKEIDEGILQDVETFITSYENDVELDTPSIWMIQHEWESYEEKPLAQKYTLKLPVEIACIEYDDNLKEGEYKTLNMVGRVIAGILKHYRRKQKLFTFRKIELREIYPNGSLKINNKHAVVAVSGVILDFIVDIDWMKCYRIDSDGTKSTGTL